MDLFYFHILNIIQVHLLSILCGKIMIIFTSSTLVSVLLVSTLHTAVSDDYDNLRNCPVSRLINPPSSGVFPYPEFYFGEIYNVNKTTEFPSTLSQYSCNTNHLLCGLERPFNDDNSKVWTDKLYQRHQNMGWKVGGSYGEGDFLGNSTVCVNNLCPLVDTNMNATWAVQEWDFRADALCLLKEGKKLRKGEESTKTRIIAFGGSMTRGHGGNGYCCVAAAETIDKDFARQEGRSPVSSILNSDSDECMPPNATPTHPDKSKRYCSWFGQLMRWFLSAFPEADMEFYNFAMSGTGSWTMAPEVSFFFQSNNISLTSRDIIILDHSCNDSGGRSSEGIELLIRAILHLCESDLHLPTIIVMEQFGDSNDGYRQAARHYELPVYSFAEMMLHPTPSQKSLFDWKRTMTLHVPWHTHMLIADSFSRWMADIVEYHCSPGQPTATISSYMSQVRARILPLRPPPSDRSSSSTAVYKVKPALNHLPHARAWECDKNIPPLLHSTSSSTHHPADPAYFEKHLLGWTEFIDHHPPAAWVINKYAPSSTYDLVFPLSNITNSKAEVGVRIKYLRTYTNAGRALVSLCGVPSVDLDALAFAGDLTDDIRNVSIPQYYSTVLSPQLVAKCEVLPDDLRNVTISYKGTSFSDERNPHRHSYKFKLYSVTACYTDIDD